MTDVARLIADMVKAGVDPEIIGRTAEALSRTVQTVQVVQDDVADKRREYDRKRKAAKRNSTGIPPESAESTGLAPSPKESSPTPPKEITPSQSEAKASSKTPRAELARVLDEVRAGAVVDHRQRIRKPLTAHAARLLAGKFAKWPDPNAAADAMVANGWQGFEPEWMERLQQPRGSPVLIKQKPEKLANGFSRVLNDMRQERAIRSGESGTSVPALIPDLSVIPGGR